MSDRALTGHTGALRGMKPWEIVLHVALSAGVFVVIAVSEHAMFAVPAVFLGWFAYLCGTVLVADEDEPMLRRMYEQQGAES